MHDPQEHALVCKALRDGLTNCVAWDGKSAERVRQDVDLQGLTPKGLRQELIQHVRSSGDDVVIQVKETREPYCNIYGYYYKVILPLAGFRHGVFVEMRLTGDDDHDFPEVTLVNAHRQRI